MLEVLVGVGEKGGLLVVGLEGYHRKIRIQWLVMGWLVGIQGGKMM
jgi:hypothetical protein